MYANRNQEEEEEEEEESDETSENEEDGNESNGAGDLVIDENDETENLSSTYHLECIGCTLDTSKNNVKSFACETCSARVCNSCSKTHYNQMYSVCASCSNKNMINDK